MTEAERKEEFADGSVYLPDYVTDLMTAMADAGEEIYLVGGSLRDMLLGIEPHDFDLATSAPPEKTAEVFSHLRVIETGIKHGTVTVLSEGHPIEITTFRIDGSYTDSRHPDEVTYTRRIEEDLARRDFTVNAMAYHPQVGVVDPFGGRSDLTRRVLRAVGDPTLRFTEDALRIMRAYRFSAQLGFSIEENTLRAAVETAEGLSHIAVERIAAELLRLVLSRDPFEALSLMIEGGILPYALEDYRPTEAILRGLSRMPAEDTARLGLLLAGAERQRAADLLRRLRFSNKQITGASAVAFGSLCRITGPEEARQLIAATGAHAPNAVRGSVVLGNSPAEAVEWVTGNRGACRISELAISGRELSAIGLRGRQIGAVLEELLALVMKDPNRNTPEALLQEAEAIKGRIGQA